MPVLINKDTGAAENVEQDLAQQATASTHDIPLIDPEGNHVVAPYSEAHTLLQQGYTQPKTEQLQSLLDYTKSDQPAELAKTFAEGAANPLTLGLSTLAETKLGGVNPEDIRRRREMNPVTYGGGQFAGLMGGTLLGTTEARAAAGGVKLMEIAGEAAAHASGLGKIGSMATNMAVQNALFGAGDELSKHFSEDPHQTMESAVADIGLSGLLGMGAGAGFKGAGELWKFGPGKQLESILKVVKNKAEGLPVELKTTAGIELPPEMEGALMADPAGRRAFQLAREGAGSGDLAVQETFDAFNKEVKNAAAASLGKAPEDITMLGSMSKAETGKALQDSLVKAIEEKVGPLNKQYDEFANKFSTAEVDDLQRVKLENNIAQMIADEGLTKGGNDAGLALAQKALNDVKLQENAKDLRQYATNLKNSAPFGSEKYTVGQKLRKLYTEAVDGTVEATIASKNPELLDLYKQTNANYADFKNTLESLNDRVHAAHGKKYGANTFIENVKEMDPESLVSKLSLKDDSTLQSLLQNQFPEVNNIVKANEVNKLVRASLDKSGEALDFKKLSINLNKMEPELRNFLVPPEGQARIQALEELTKLVPEKLNPLKGEHALNSLWSKIPASAAGLASFLTGHNPVAGYLIGKAMNYMGKEVPAATRLAYLKFLGKQGAINAEGFKAAAQAANASIKGNKLVARASAEVFESGLTVAAASPPEPKRINALQKQIDRLTDNPEELFTGDNKMGHYVPEHATAVGAINGRALTYLASLRPSTAPLGPLEGPRKVSKSEEADYKQALVIAEQPLTVLRSIKEGSLTPKDMEHLYNLYPALYERLQDKLTKEMTVAIGKGKLVPYKTKIALSMFLAQPLERSLTPGSIQSSQIMPVMAPTEPQQRTRSNPSITKLPQSYATPGQSREFNRSRH